MASLFENFFLSPKELDLISAEIHLEKNEYEALFSGEQWSEDTMKKCKDKRKK